MNKKIEFGELRITELAKKHIEDCLNRNWVSIGIKVSEFEQRWCDLFGYKHTVMFSSGTSALTAACIALYDYGAKPGDYIIVPALSFIASANAIRAAGFTPYFVDIEKETLQIDYQKFVDVVSILDKQKIAGVVAVNLMGKPCALKGISSICKIINKKLIVDNCEGYGCKREGKFSLDYADMEVTSHYIAHIICSGEGGTVSCKDENLRDILRSIRSHGRAPDSLYFEHFRYGLNLKPNDLCASIGLGEIDDFWKIFNKRKINLYRFREAASFSENKCYFVEENDDDINAPHAFSITLNEKFATESNLKTLICGFADANIAWKRNFGSIPKHQAFNYLPKKELWYPQAEYVGDWGIHIGCHYWLSDEDINHICKTIRETLEKIK